MHKESRRLPQSLSSMRRERVASHDHPPPRLPSEFTKATTRRIADKLQILALSRPLALPFLEAIIDALFEPSTEQNVQHAFEQLMRSEAQAPAPSATPDPIPETDHVRMRDGATASSGRAKALRTAARVAQRHVETLQKKRR
jgi:hypothetical protein